MRWHLCGRGRRLERARTRKKNQMAEANAEFNIAKENFRVSEDFLAKYNTPGPRYTSYPTAPAWNDNFGVKDLESAYSDADAAGTPMSLYMHLPYCESLC